MIKTRMCVPLSHRLRHDHGFGQHCFISLNIPTFKSGCARIIGLTDVFDQGTEIRQPVDGNESSYVKRRQRVAAIALTFLMERCASILTSYVADAPLRGVMPFPR
jgi:hypothetical protein